MEQCEACFETPLGGDGKALFMKAQALTQECSVWLLSGSITACLVLWKHSGEWLLKGSGFLGVLVHPREPLLGGAGRRSFFLVGVCRVCFEAQDIHGEDFQN